MFHDGINIRRGKGIVEEDRTLFYNVVDVVNVYGNYVSVLHLCEICWALCSLARRHNDYIRFVGSFRRFNETIRKY